jgi:hypothetical protein
MNDCNLTVPKNQSVREKAVGIPATQSELLVWLRRRLAEAKEQICCLAPPTTVPGRWTACWKGLYSIAAKF